MSKLMSRALVLASALMASHAALAAEPVATLSNIEGTALVNQGEEFVTASESQALVAGDRVLVMEGGRADLTFADGCALPVEAGSMVVVPEQSTCAGGVASTQNIGPQLAQAVGEGTADEPNSLTQGLVIGGTILAIALIVSEDDEEPSSP